MGRLGMMNARRCCGATERRAIPARKKKPARQRSRQKQKTEITRHTGNEKIRTVCRRRAGRWVIASVVVPVDGYGLSFRLCADAVVCGQEIGLLIAGQIVQERAGACADETSTDKVNSANRLGNVLPGRCDVDIA